MALLGTVIMLSGHSAVSQAAVRPCQLQLCAMLGSSGIKLSEYICTGPSFLFLFFLSSPSDPKFMHIYIYIKQILTPILNTCPVVREHVFFSERLQCTP